MPGLAQQLQIFVSCYATATHPNGTFHHIYTPAGVNCFSGFEMHVKSLNEPVMAPSWEYLSKSHALMAQFHFLVSLAIWVRNEVSFTCDVRAVHCADRGDEAFPIALLF